MKVVFDRCNSAYGPQVREKIIMKGRKGKCL